MQILTVVNRMLATMGERPLASLSEGHSLLGAAQAKITEASRAVQSRGWWFNMEELTLSPSNFDSTISLPNDTLSIRSEEYNVVKRGAKMYNLKGGTYVFDSSLDVILIRELTFSDLPETAASYVAAMAVASFQTSFDGDTAKARDLSQEVVIAFAVINAEHTRSRRTNFIARNTRLQRLKGYTSAARKFIST